VLIAQRRTGLWVVFLVVMTSTTARADSNWPGWRGPQTTGHSAEKDLPVRWNNDSVVWKTRLKGRGHSSPITWAEKIFLTTALGNGAQRVVLCIDRNDGEILWEKTAWTGQPEPSNKLNGWASSTPTTDGERVYAFFGRGGGIHCYTVQGEPVWSKELGEFTNPWGTAASPVLVGDLVIQNCDADKNAYIIALDKKTGKTAWKAKRDDHRGWSTPVLITAAGREELVINGHTGVQAYDPLTGAELWHCKSFNGRGTPTIAPANGLLHVVNGLSGDTYAIKPGGTGDVTKTRMVWHTPRRGRDLPSPIVIDNFVLVMSLRPDAILTIYDAANGAELWKERVGGKPWASPVAYGGLAFFMLERGETVVIDPAKKTGTGGTKIVARNTVDLRDDELFRASITPSGGQVFLRSDQVLYCIGKRAAAKSQ